MRDGLQVTDTATGEVVVNLPKEEAADALRRAGGPPDLHAPVVPKVAVFRPSTGESVELPPLAFEPDSAVVTDSFVIIVTGRGLLRTSI